MQGLDNYLFIFTLFTHFAQAYEEGAYGEGGYGTTTTPAPTTPTPTSPTPTSPSPAPTSPKPVYSGTTPNTTSTPQTTNTPATTSDTPTTNTQKTPRTTTTQTGVQPNSLPETSSDGITDPTWIIIAGAIALAAFVTFIVLMAKKLNRN